MVGVRSVLRRLSGRVCHREKGPPEKEMEKDKRKRVYRKCRLRKNRKSTISLTVKKILIVRKRISVFGKYERKIYRVI